jgi:hypothetical protein
MRKISFDDLLILADLFASRSIISTKTATLHKMTKNIVRWTKPSLKEEIGEFRRVVDEGYADNLFALISAFENGKLVQLGLDDEKWRNIENADSGQDLTLDEAKKLAQKYGRNINSIIEGISSGAIMPAPIILELPNGVWHNVAGNTRLMVCRALGISPMVWFMRLDDA